MNENRKNMMNNMAEWYQNVVAEARLAEHSPVKGCMTIRPYGYAIWELIKEQLDKEIKKHGAQNMSFPLFIPYSYLAREKDHVEGFSPEIAVVTHAGGKELQEPLVVRPTSETIIHESMAKWIQSYKDLPLRLNQWCNVVRWEKHPRLFLRTTEFQWQEGHTAHATEKDARKEVDEMVEIYYNFVKDVLAIPSIKGKKSEKEKFAGAVDSYSIEGLMPDGKVVQMGTVHYLGQNFAKMANVKFESPENPENFVHMTSWGVSTRLIGSLIMVHGDDKGLVLPPKVAPTQVVIVPIGDTVEFAKGLKAELENVDIRVELDDRQDVRPGAKYYEHEMRGVPLRLEVGKRELENKQIQCAIRVDGTKFQISLESDYISTVKQTLQEIQDKMLANATNDMEERIIEANNKEEFEKLINEQAGFIKANWCDEKECEQKIKEALGANTRNLPYAENDKEMPECTCVWCGKKAKKVAYFAKAY